MPQPPLDYETPPPRPPLNSAGCGPYVAFAVCAIAIIVGASVMFSSNGKEVVIGGAIAAVGAVGAISLPIVIALQRR